MIAVFSTQEANFPSQLAALLQRQQKQDTNLSTQVKQIIHDVQARGDEALLQYTTQWDGWTPQVAADLRLADADWHSLSALCTKEQRHALDVAFARIFAFHKTLLPQDIAYKDTIGTLIQRQYNPMQRVGVYVPGGSASYPSTVLMNAIPAKVAGVQEIVMCVPKTKGEISPLIAYAAKLVGIDSIYCIGGAQAIAAMAYGTRTLACVQKIVGPGNTYVAEAKKQVFGVVGIDSIAGPSEVLVVAEEGINPTWIAADLLAQAEHDTMAQAILLTTSAKLITDVQSEIFRLLPTLPRQTIIRESLRNWGACILLQDYKEVIPLVAKIAPEHLELMGDYVESLAPQIRHAGAVFVGRYTSEALGDYCVGSNHVLPTSGSARFSSGLGVIDFLLAHNTIRVNQQGSQELGKIAGVLAQNEKLHAHALSALCRLT